VFKEFLCSGQRGGGPSPSAPPPKYATAQDKRTLPTDRHDDVRLVTVEPDEADVCVGQTETVRARWNATVTGQSLRLERHRPDVLCKHHIITRHPERRTVTSSVTVDN